MKLLSIAIPCYNSEDYLSKAVESLLPGGDEVEIICVNDGSRDGTAALIDAYAQKYPGIVKAVHQENAGHGGAVMAGLRNASGLYFKVVDSDDRVDKEAYLKILSTLRRLSDENIALDLLISNYVYDKVGVKNKRVVSFSNALPENRVLSWEEARHFRVGQYILMHAAIYRTKVLRDCALELPRHTFYVDSLYVYIPLPYVKTLYYLNVNFYLYYIGREDQSIQEKTMIKRIDQQFRVNLLMNEAVSLPEVKDSVLRRYMLNYLEIISTVSNVLSILSRDEAILAKNRAMWEELAQKRPENYRLLKNRPMIRLSRTPGAPARALTVFAYRVSRKIYGFN